MGDWGTSRVVAAAAAIKRRDDTAALILEEFDHVGYSALMRECYEATSDAPGATRHQREADWMGARLARMRAQSGVQPDPAAAAMVSEAAVLLEEYGDHELGDL